jgi:hypothetical protein
MMISDLDIAGCVVGTLVLLYIVAATWRSKDQDPPARDHGSGKLPGR